MNNKIFEYIKNGITINGNPIDGYRVFTIPTQHFRIDSLDELTPETFENAIQKQKDHDELTSEIFREVSNEIDMEIVNRLKIMANNIDRLYNDYLVYVIEGVKNGFDRIKGYLDECLVEFDGSYEHFTNPSFQYGFRPLTLDEFIDKLLFDDDFYQKWGDNCCEELTEEERYEIWFNNNYETGMERYFDPNNLPDYDNDYYEPTPKRKLK
jgi:hypothetical protein